METCELLISEVQKRSMLWNKFDKKYKDRVACDKEWSILAKKINKYIVKYKLLFIIIFIMLFIMIINYLLLKI